MNKNARTSSYVTTIYFPKGDALNFALEPIRKSVALVNKEIRQRWNCSPESDQHPLITYRVSVKGRLGRNNPKAFKYRVGGSRQGCAKAGAILSSDAAHFDIYIHSVRKW
jgi:hypothetical protein